MEFIRLPPLFHSIRELKIRLKLEQLAYLTNEKINLVATCLYSSLSLR